VSLLAHPETAQETQSAVAELVAAAVAQAFADVDPHDLARSIPLLRLRLRAVVAKYGQTAASLAVIQYRAARAAAGVAGSFAATPAQPDLAAVDGLIAWATSGLWTPAGATTDAAQTAVAMVAAQAKSTGVAQGLALDAGSDTILNAVRQDPKARGWARIPEPGACPFCLMLAIRGAVYKAETSADFRAHHVQANGTGGECRCHVEPNFSTHYEPTAQVREAQQLWETSTKGLSGKDARLAFRQAVEGRAATARTHAAHGRLARPVQPSPEAARRIAAQLENALATMRANNAGGRLDAAIAATERRLTELR